jgi:HAMP domain-containing protein
MEHDGRHTSEDPPICWVLRSPPQPKRPSAAALLVVRALASPAPARPLAAALRGERLQRGAVAGARHEVERRLRALRDFLVGAAEGDLVGSPPPGSGDEVGEASEALARMLDLLRSVLEEVRAESAIVSARATEFTDIAGRMGHEAGVARLRAFLDGLDSISSEQVTSPRDCDLGRPRRSAL